MIRRTKQEKIFYYTQPGFFKKKLDEFNQAEEKVTWLLGKYEELRNSDKLLLFYYWRLINNYQGELEDNDILNLTPGETITRVRRYIQNDLNLFLPTDEDVIRAREISALAVSEWARNQGRIVID